MNDATAESIEAAGYVELFTTVDKSRLSAARCMHLYRLRWQIELLFKRLKSLCGLDRMPNYRPRHHQVVDLREATCRPAP